MKKQYDFKNDRFYNSNHLWMEKDESGKVTVGMDELGLDSLGELAYLTLPGVVGSTSPKYDVEAIKEVLDNLLLIS